MINAYDVDETFVKIDCDDTEIKVQIANYLSAYVEGYQFTPSYRAGFWDGKKKFFKVSNAGELLILKGLVYHVKRKLKEEGIKLNYTNGTDIPQVTEEQLQAHIKSLNLPFEPYDYQFNTAFDFINRGRITAQLGTGAGKSLIAFIISTWFESQGQTVLILVPNVSLTNQLQSDFIKDYQYAKPENIHLISAGKEKHFDCPITISTWQSSIRMLELLSEIDVLIIDEAHQAKAEIYDEVILPAVTNCKYRLGLSGTISDLSYADRMSLVGTIGPNKKYINAQGLIDRGLATPTEIKCLFFNYPMEEKEKMKKAKYQDEVKYIEKHVKRNTLLAKMTNKIAKNGNTILLFNKIEHGKWLMELIVKDRFGIDNFALLEKPTPKSIEKILVDGHLPEKVFTNTALTEKQVKSVTNALKKLGIDASELERFDALEHYDIYMIYGAIEGEERERIRHLLEDKEDAVIVGNYATMSTGVNIKRLSNIIFGASTKSSILIRQSIGRGLRLHKKKEVTKIWDVTDDFSTVTKTGKTRYKNHTLKHWESRLLSYEEDGFPISEKEIQL